MYNYLEKIRYKISPVFLSCSSLLYNIYALLKHQRYSFRMAYFINGSILKPAAPAPHSVWAFAKYEKLKKKKQLRRTHDDGIAIGLKL